MKLTNQQIDALTNKIYDEISADVLSQYNSNMAIIKKKFAKTKEYQAFTLLNDLLGYKVTSEQNILAKLYDIPKSPINNKSKIRNEIVLSTIKCDNLDELIEKVKASVTE